MGRFSRYIPLPMIPKYSPNTEVFDVTVREGDPLIIGYAYIQDSPFILLMIKNKNKLMKEWQLDAAGTHRVFNHQCVRHPAGHSGDGHLSGGTGIPGRPTPGGHAAQCGVRQQTGFHRPAGGRGSSRNQQPPGHHQ